MAFTTLDSGERQEFDSGMRRDTDKGKARFDLIPAPMLQRLAELYARGSFKYGDRNWEKANSKVEMDRFKASAFRHFMAWQNGAYDEDHATAVVFNVFAYETVVAKINAAKDDFSCRLEQLHETKCYECDGADENLHCGACGVSYEE